MKTALLAATFIPVLSSVGATAQTVFIPQPPVVNIPVLDPSGMIIQNEVNRNTINGAGQGGGTKGAKTRPSASPDVDYTKFNPRQESYMPKVLAQAARGGVAEQRQAEQFFNTVLANYEQIASNHHELPANDVAYAFVDYILINYQVYYDLYDVPREKDPWVKRAKDGFERLALLDKKRVLTTTTEEDRAMYYQIKGLLSAKPEFRRMTDEDKQRMTETMVITAGVVKDGYLKAVGAEDGRLIEQAHETARGIWRNYSACR